MSILFLRTCALLAVLYPVLGFAQSAESPLDEDTPPIQRQFPPELPASQPKKALPGMPELSADCAGADRFGGTHVERSGYCQLLRRKYASLRTQANAALKASPDSFRAHYLIGTSHHLGEGNLPKALFHLQRAEAIFIAKYGPQPSKETSPSFAYQRTLIELVYVHGEMDHHEEKIRYVNALQRRLDLDFSPLKAWPLLKLKRFDEARAVAKKAAENEESWSAAVGKTALCAVESELRDRHAAYEACSDAARPYLRSDTEGAIELSNAGAAAEEVFKFDEAERLYTDAARRRPEGSVNPWGRLVRLHARQGRISEAIDAWIQMRAYRKRRPDYLLQQDQSEADLIGASVLLVVGREKGAETIIAKTVSRPDRQGTSSATSEQNEAGAFIMDRVAKRAKARVLEEEASSAKFLEAMKLRAKALDLRFSAWTSGRKAGELLANRERLVVSFRPECPGSIELPAWLDAEIIDVVGPGVALAAIEEARKEETLSAELAEPIFAAFEAEAYFLAGDDDLALQRAQLATKRLSKSDALVRARVAAIGAQAAVNLGDHPTALSLFRSVLSIDPSVIRRLGLALPVQLQGTQVPEVVEALELLSDSPRINEVNWGFVLVVSQDQAQLHTEDGSRLIEIKIPAGRQDSTESSARRIARAVNRGLLMPQIDMTQGQIKSLDGSISGSGRAGDRVRSVMDQVLKELDVPPSR